MERLYDRSTKEQWRVDDMDWDAIDFDHIPRPLRQAAANMFTQLHYGELAALIGAARTVEHAPTLAVRMFSSVQVNDEARHVQWFSRLMEKLDCRAPVLTSVTDLVSDVHDCDDFEGSVLGLHLMIEGMAHSLIVEGARALSSLDQDAALGSHDGVSRVFADWLPNFLGRDESRHVAFGVRLLNERLKDLSSARRGALEARLERWIALFVEVVRDPQMLAVPGIDTGAMRDACAKELNARLEAIGMESRVPELDSNTT